MNKQEFEREFLRWCALGFMPDARAAAERIDSIFGGIHEKTRDERSQQIIATTRDMVAEAARFATSSVDQPNPKAIYERLKTADNMVEQLQGIISERRQLLMRALGSLAQAYAEALAQRLLSTRMDLAKAILAAGGGEVDQDRTDPDTPTVSELGGALMMYFEYPDEMDWPR